MTENVVGADFHHQTVYARGMDGRLSPFVRRFRFRLDDADAAVGSRCTASSCRSTHSGVWTTSRGVIRAS